MEGGSDEDEEIIHDLQVLVMATLPHSVIYLENEHKNGNTL